MKGCLLLHGFNGDPCDMNPLADVFNEKNILTHCPILHVRDQPKKNLRRSTYLDWIQSAHQGYKELSQQCSDIAVVGFSMGGLLAFHLTQRYQPKCMVTMGAPIYCLDGKNILHDISNSIKNKDYLRILDYTALFRIPLKANYHFVKILRSAKPLIKELDVPLFVIQGRKDPIVKAKSAQYIFDHAKTPQKEIRYYDRTSHRFYGSVETPIIFEDIVSFVSNHL
ncbi:carboxylesterase [Anaerosolibacter carboniphilus]|uniref:Carboxylesterase n=1 Tax=Anaerosolibacter carboniphilus TaxID=1417629 RepID=A0A841L003_9FIRM|nr:alpha/beta hydrolase [Anaerosolibacter carboniphilus]MBB6218947.1 carboxylesterase [Anaerosolibacter carboniphilus]